jgi:hypothetical protein
MAVTTLQVTQTGSAKQVAPLGTYARWIKFVNLAAAQMTVGDVNVSATRGDPLVSSTGVALYPALADVSNHYDLGQWWTIGTNTQLLTVVYDSMT